MALEDKIDALIVALGVHTTAVKDAIASLNGGHPGTPPSTQPEAPADEPASETKRGRGRPRKAETAPPAPPPDDDPSIEEIAASSAPEPEAPSVTAKDIIDAVARAKQVIAIPDLKKLVGEYSDTGKAADIPLSAGAAFIAAVKAFIAEAEEV